MINGRKQHACGPYETDARAVKTAGRVCRAFCLSVKPQEACSSKCRLSLRPVCHGGRQTSRLRRCRRLASSSAAWLGVVVITWRRWDFMLTAAGDCKPMSWAQDSTGSRFESGPAGLQRTFEKTNYAQHPRNYRCCSLIHFEILCTVLSKQYTH